MKRRTLSMRRKTAWGGVEKGSYERKRHPCAGKVNSTWAPGHDIKNMQWFGWRGKGGN